MKGKIWSVFLLLHARALVAQSRPLHWTATNVVLAATFEGLLQVDAAQTRAFRRDGHPELNPLLGREPSIGRVNTLTTLAAIGGLGVGAVLPGKWRNAWFIALVVGEGITVLHNKFGFRGSVKI